MKFDIVDWLAAPDLEPVERETLASLRITTGPTSVPITEVEDTIAQTVRQHINVSAYSLARWLMINWWRIRWEPARQHRSPDWLTSHCLAAVGGDYAWPAVVLSSDGEFIQVHLQAESAPDVSAVRYLRSVALDLPATDFEAGVDEFFDKVEARLKLRIPSERELGELRHELRGEREDPDHAALCRLQARAGIDPGAASEGWLKGARALVAIAGDWAAEEILATTPSLLGGLRDVEVVVQAMKSSSTTVDLGWAEVEHATPQIGELPWERGSRLARQLRARLGFVSGPVATSHLESLLSAKLPLPKADWSGSRALRGGFRNGVTQGRTAVLVTSPRVDSQRFYLARLIGAAVAMSKQEHVLAVSDEVTALQKFERSFAQEFLCPWNDLDGFTEQAGTNEEGIADAAEHFGVSEWLIASTLVNRGKLPRSRLPAR